MRNLFPVSGEPESLYSNDLGAYLRERGEAIIAPMGFSMLPLLKGDSCQVILKYPEQPPCKYDVVLYRRVSDGRLVLHRIIQCTPQGYLIRGDNTYQDEKGITEEQILGVMTGFYRKDRYISCEDRRYLLYVRAWTLLYPFRRFLVRALRYLRRKIK